MLDTGDYRQAVLKLGERYTANPGNFVTEHDVQFELISALRCGLDRFENEEPIRPTLQNTPSRSFKIEYVRAIQDGYDHAEGGFHPIHTEVSIEKGQRFDVGVFNQSVEEVTWDSGSKKFNEAALSALFEVKFVKNWKKIDTEVGFKPSREGEELSDEELLSKFKWETVGFKSDVESLGKRTSPEYRCAILFSNFNYLYFNPTKREDAHNPLYIRMGKLAREQLAEIGREQDVSILYACPRGREKCQGGSFGGIQWLYDSTSDEKLVAR